LWLTYGTKDANTGEPAAPTLLAAVFPQGSVPPEQDVDAAASAPGPARASFRSGGAAATATPDEGPRSTDVANLLDAAQRFVSREDIPAARDALARAEFTGDPLAAFALAETYDPNMLAAWGVRGVSADPAKARALYSKAFAAGLTRAQTRLSGLQ
jgi:TPR repeat protein